MMIGGMTEPERLNVLQVYFHASNSQHQFVHSEQLRRYVFTASYSLKNAKPFLRNWRLLFLS